jgi:23S rRNA pseudouridine2605 synthase
MTTRLQKVLASSGLGSRRACEALITEGRVTVDGRTATIGMSVEPGTADVRVDGVRVRAAEAPVYLALYKPTGVVTASRSQDGRTTVLDLVDVRERIFPVGRLDVDSEGLVLLTNDGPLAQVLTHPRHGHEKEYRVLLDVKPSADQLRRWRDGVRLPDGTRALSASVQPEGAGTWVRVIMRQGRKRQIRDTAGLLGLHVQRLVRVRIASLGLGGLRPGQWRALTPEEVRGLRRGMPSAPHPKAKRSTHRDGHAGAAEGRG